MTISMTISMEMKKLRIRYNPCHPCPIYENNTIHHPKGIPANL